MSDAGPRAFSELWVCFEPPPADPPAHALVVSFMRPSVEAEAEARWGAQCVSGRALVNEVRPRARAEYVRLIARLGATADANQRTLRQAVQGPDGYSRWWLLQLTEKDCVWDGDPTYITMLQLMAVQSISDRHGIDRTLLYGASRTFSAALGQSVRTGGMLAGVLRATAAGLLGRMALVAEGLGLWWVLRRLPRPRLARPDVLLQAYWDWSVRPDGSGGLRDRYFTDLPSQLSRRGVTVGWLASCETRLELWQRGRRQQDVLAASCAHPGVTLLERYWTPADIVRAAGRLRYPLRATRFVLGRQFQAACCAGSLDFYPLVRDQLLRAMWGSTFCRLELVATATARACRELRPKAVVTFMELFLRARAIYAGVAASSIHAAVWAAQHAGYSSDKTLGVVDPEIEMRGTPDGCAMPAPGGMFVMGDLSRRLWQATGLAPERVIQTGGLRYQSVQVRPRGPRPVREGISVLLAGGMNETAEIDLCDAAVSAAAGLESVRLLWRDHPIYQFSRRQAFDAFRDRIAVTSRTLDEDLEAADLVLFTHAGIAEEALLIGIPVWQWLWAGFNTSPFLDIRVIPSFSSVRALRQEVELFVADPSRYQPTPDIQRRVLHECFGSDPPGASARIADAIQALIGGEARALA